MSEFLDTTKSRANVWREFYTSLKTSSKELIPVGPMKRLLPPPFRSKCTPG